MARRQNRTASKVQWVKIDYAVDLPVGHHHHDEQGSPMPTWKISGVLEQLQNQTGWHSSYTEAQPRDRGNARPKDLAAMGHKVNRRSTLLDQHKSRAIKLGNVVTGGWCPGCRNSTGPSGETAEDVVTTLTRRGHRVIG